MVIFSIRVSSCLRVLLAGTRWVLRCCSLSLLVLVLTRERRLLCTRGDNEEAVTDIPKLGSDLFVFSQEELYLHRITPALFLGAHKSIFVQV